MLGLAVVMLDVTNISVMLNVVLLNVVLLNVVLLRVMAPTIDIGGDSQNFL